MGIDELTRRESEVADAVVTGASNEAVAKQLGIGRRTVESHLGSIYTKLGVTTRTALVAALLGSGRFGDTMPAPAADRPPEGPRGVLRSLARPRAPVTFVGREREIADVARVFREVRAGSAGTVLVGGEPGVGKTSLLGAALEAPDAVGFTLLVGRCTPGLSAPYGPVLSALSPYLEQAAGPLDRLTGPGGGALLPAMPELAGRLSPLPAGTDPVAAPRLLVEAVAHILATSVAEGPVALVLEDLHWADLGTLALLRHLLIAARLPGLVVLASFRDTDLHREHPLPGLLADLWNVDGVLRLNLSGLSTCESLALAEELAPGALVASTVERLHDQSAGNPLFLNLVIRHLAEGVEDGADLPRGLHEVVAQRVQRYDPASETPLTVAAVAGLRFDTALLQEVLVEDGTAGHAPLLPLLRGAVGAGLLVDDDECAGGFRFVHDLVRLALLEQMSPVRRDDLHVLVGRAMLASPATTRSHAAAAGHLAKPSRPADRFLAAQVALLGATEALERHAPDDAAELVASALAWLPPDATGRGEIPGVPDDDRELQLRLLLLRVDAEMGRFDIAEHRSAVLAGATLARKLERAEELAKAAGSFRIIGLMGRVDDEIEALQQEALACLDGFPPSALRAKLLSSVAYRRALGGDNVSAPSVAAEAIAEAERVGDPEVLAEAHLSMCLVLMGSPDVRRRRAVGRSCSALADELPNAFAPMMGRVFLALADLCDGDRSAFEAQFAAFEEEGARLHNTVMSAFVGEFRHLAAMLDGDLEAAEEAAGVALAAAGDDPNFLLGWFAQMCVLRAEQDRAAEMVPLIRQTVDQHGDLAAVRAVAAWVWSAAGDHDAASRVLEPVLAAGLGSLPQDWLLPGALSLVTPTIAAVGSSEERETVLELLAPYRGQGLVVGMGTELMGVADGCSALLRATTEPEAAVADLEAALEQLARLRAPVLAANLLADYADLTGDPSWCAAARSRFGSGRTPRLDRRLRKARV